MRIATVQLLIDVDSDAEACDFLSETLREMPYLIDWAHAKVPDDKFHGEYTAQYVQTDEYQEGDFLQAAKAVY